MGTKHILVVEDSAQLRTFLVDSLQLNDRYRVSAATNGADGLATALESSPDLVITDISMPHVSGLDMLAELRAAGRQIPAIVITAEGSERTAVQALRLGAVDYFTKPFEIEEFEAAVAAALSVPQQEAVDASPRPRVMRTLIAVGKALTTLGDRDLMLARIVEAAIFLAEAEEGALLTFDPQEESWHFHATKNLPATLIETTISMEETPISRIAVTGKPIHIDEDTASLAPDYAVTGLLAVPVQIGERVIGVLEVHNRQTDAAFSDEMIGPLTILADYATIAMSRTQVVLEEWPDELALLFEQLNAGLFVLDENERVLMCNTAALPIFEKLPDGIDPAGWALGELTSNPSLIELSSSALRGDMMQGEVQLTSGRTLSAQASDIVGMGYAFILHDVTHLKEMDKAKTELIELVSHQVRSPLTAILSYIEFLQRTGELNPNQVEFAYQVRRNVELITATINDLLDLGKIEAGMDHHREALDLANPAQVAIDALRPRLKAKDQTLEVNIAEDLAPVLGNAVRLRQIFVNLIENAIKYTPIKGRIKLSIIEEEGQIVSRIVDTGIGIPLEEQSLVFEKFYRASDVTEAYEGTGLGLSIVKSIVEAHEGRIWVESSAEHGTIFTVVLPVYDPKTNAIRTTA